MSNKLKLYGFSLSPPVRAVLLTLKALELEFEYVPVNTFVGENKTPEYLKKNPTHTIPTLEDNGKFLYDSHAICTYLVSKYGKDDSLYPKDLYKRAIVDQRLHYENGVLFMSLLKQTVSPLLRGTTTKAEFQEKLKAVFEAYDVLEIFLGTNEWLAGSSLTVADLSIVSSVSSIVPLAPLDAGKWPKLAAWMERMTKLPYYAEANAEGANAVRDMALEKLAQMQ